MIEEKFTSRIEKYNIETDLLNKLIQSISTLRLVVFIILGFVVYEYIKSNNSNLYFYLLLISIAAFVSLVILHTKIKNKLNYIEGLININNRYLDRINGNWRSFTDSGEDFMDNTHRYSNDLDIVGPSSLFQRINISHNYTGRQALAKDLLDPEYKEEEILKRQTAIKELSSKLDFVQKLEYESSKNNKLTDPKGIISYFSNNERFTYRDIEKSLIKLLPIATFVIAAIILFLQIKSLFIVPLILVLSQIALWLIGSKRNGEVLDGLGNFKNNLEVYVGLLDFIEKENFTSSLLNKEKNALFANKSSINAIKELDIISERINLKHNGLLYLLLNIFTLWDYRSVFALEDWKSKYGSDVANWIYSIGKIQSLSSLSVLLQIEENISFPIIENTPSVISKDCGHPLIEMEERVYNNINIKDNILIITGSNMSGKTTFLRTIGVNLVLLNAGTITISKEFKSPIINVFTSMRISDDLENKISTFYAELLRIKEILDFAKDNENTLFLIDEIFKGTNSKDRILGAKNVLMNLNKLGLIGVISTHDFELCELDVYPRIENYHFAEDYIDGKISFDYKIKKGRSYSTNALHLMQLVGIDIIE